MHCDKLKYWLALLHIPGIGPASFSRIFEQGLNPANLFESPEFLKLPELRLPAEKPDWHAVERDIAWQQELPQQRFIITLDDPEYPEILKQQKNPPPLLYVQGNVECLQAIHFAVVGSRNPGCGAGDTARHFSAQLAEAGFSIVSGLALGIDAAAHQGALLSKGKTLAIMATGPDRIYPARHHALAHEIVDAGGALVSEYPLSTALRPGNFPRRNRIISGLSVGVLVVEAALKSGSLITARLAAEQNKDVFAIPGSINNPLSQGCHQLIREGAILTESVQDILYELDTLLQQHIGAKTAMPEKNSSSLLTNVISETTEGQGESVVIAQSAKVLEYIDFAPTSMDVIVARSGILAGEISAALLMLELQGYVEAMPGAMYMKMKEL